MPVGRHSGWPFGKEVKRGDACFLMISCVMPNVWFTLTEQVRLTRTGIVVRLVDESGHAAAAAPDQALVRLLVRARQWWAQLAKGEISIDELARREGVTGSWMTRTVRLAFLSPELVDGILDGALKAGTGAGAFVRTAAIAPCWQQQRYLAGNW